MSENKPMFSPQDVEQMRKNMIDFGKSATEASEKLGKEFNKIQSLRIENSKSVKNTVKKRHQFWWQKYFQFFNKK